MPDLLLLTLLLTAVFSALTTRRLFRAPRETGQLALLAAGYRQVTTRLLVGPTRAVTFRVGYGLLLLLALALVWSAQVQLATRAPFTSFIAYAGGLALLVVLDHMAQTQTRISAAGAAQRSSERSVAVDDGTEPELSPKQRWWLGLSIVGALLVGDQTRTMPPNGNYGGLVLIWLVALGFAVAAALPAQGLAFGRWRDKLARIPAQANAEWAVVAGIVVGALLLRVVALDTFPYPFGGDEGSQAMSAIAVLQGEITNPFGTGWFSVPTLFFYFQAASITLFGDSVGGVRMISALMGTVGILLTYLLARRWFGIGIAVAAAAILATFHFHVNFSRLASVQIADPFFLIATLLLLDSGLRRQRRFDCLLAGMAIGLSQYFYLGGRVVPFVAMAYAVMLIASMKWAGWLTVEGRKGLPAQIRLLAWVALGAILVFLPIFGYYVAHPIEFQAHFNQVSIFATGWLVEQMAATGSSIPILIWEQAQKALLLPYHTAAGGWYRGWSPFIGVPMAVALAIGVAIVTAGLLRPAYFALAAAYWGVFAGLALTVDPAQTQRLVIVAPIIAILIAIALASVARIAVRLVSVPVRVAHGLAGVALLGLCAWNVHYYFHAPTEMRVYGDGNTLVATTLARHLRDLGDDYTVYFHAPPRIWYYGFQTLPFIARNATGINVNDPIDSRAPMPHLTGPTLFVFLPERVRELEHVQAWFPRGHRSEFRAPTGIPLFTIYEVRSD